MQHCELRSNRTRCKKTSPMPAGRPQENRPTYPVSPEPLPAEHQPRHNGEGSLHRASFLRQAQGRAESLSSYRLAPASQEEERRCLAEKALPQQLALEGETSQLLPKHPQTRHGQLDLEQLEETMLEMRKLQKVVRKLVAKLPPTLAAELAEDECKTESNSNNNNNNNKQQYRQQ